LKELSVLYIEKTVRRYFQSPALHSWNLWN